MIAPAQATRVTQENPAEAASRPRQIVIFCDGTNNTLTGRRRDTNVLALYLHLRNQKDGPDRLLYYDPGVGSPDALPSTWLDKWSRRWERISGLASGRGVYENIREAYAFLVRNWRPGDQIWLFGFSRGAFTARAVSGFVHLFGIIRPEHESILDTLMRVYFAKSNERRGLAGRFFNRLRILLAGLEPEPRSRHERDRVARQIRDGFSDANGALASVHFVGVWDTVESVGFPLLADVQITSKATMSDKRIHNVRHALSLDEHRRTFMPRLYSENNFDWRPDRNKSLKQLWFPGVHSDLGGGYGRFQRGLSDTTLEWMVDEARHCGLACGPMPAAPHKYQRIHDETYNVPWWALAGLTVRDTTHADRKPVTPVAHAPAPAAPASVWQRCRTLSSPIFFLAITLLALAAQCWSLGPDGAFGSARALARQQLACLWTVFSDGAVSLRDPLAADASVGWAMVFDLLMIFGYSYLLARVMSWAFAGAAGQRKIGQARPWWTLLGMAPPLVITFDVVEDLLTLLAMDWDGASGWQRAVFFLIGLASTGKFLAGLACLVLVAFGATRRAKAAPRATH